MSSNMLLAQPAILDRPDLLKMADSCLNLTYNFAFPEARVLQKEIKRNIPEHPAPDFLEAMILYWEYFPLRPDDMHADRFIDLLDHCVNLAVSMQEVEDTRLEGVFFDLFGRAFKAMFWADNGKPGKVIPDLGTMYRHTIEGFVLKDQFSEFYFATGLYNYYVEAYPEAHPVYKPLVSFMQDGDRELGLEQLDHAIKQTTFVKAQSLLFMTLIQLNYENNLPLAFHYAKRIYSVYPKNVYFQGLILTIVLHLHQFELAKEIIISTENQKDEYSEMLRILADAFMSEMSGDAGKTEQKYLSGIELAKSVGYFADTYLAIGYMGLSRLSEKKGSHKEAKSYARKAENYTVYKFILGR